MYLSSLECKKKLDAKQTYFVMHQTIAFNIAKMNYFNTKCKHPDLL